MIDLAFNLSTQLAKLVLATTIKPGSAVSVRVTFSEAPGVVSSLKLALGNDATPPAVVAYVDSFVQESDVVWTATLNANDARLITWMAGKLSGAASAELSVTVDGQALISPNVAIAVQQRILAGPDASEGGPTYPTSGEVTALIAAALSGLTLQIADDIDGHTYRLVSNNGALGLEQVS